MKYDRNKFFLIFSEVPRRKVIEKILEEKKFLSGANLTADKNKTI